MVTFLRRNCKIIFVANFREVYPLRFKIFITYVLLFFFAFTHSPSSANEMVDSKIEITHDVTGQIKLLSEEQINYIKLLKGNQYYATSIDDKYWGIQIGNGNIIIPKQYTTIVDGDLIKNTATSQVEVISIKNASIYSEPTRHSKEIAQLVKDMRISTNGLNGNFYEINIGGQKGYVHKWDVQVDNGIPILIYHHLVVDQENSIFKDSTSVYDIDLFKEQVKYLKENNYFTISLKDLDLWMQKKHTLPGKAVALTFDDANLSVEKLVYPILKENNMHATTFVIGNRVKEEIQTFNMNSFQFAGFNELRNILDVFDLEYHTYAFHEFNSKTGRSILQDASPEEFLEDFVNSKNVIKTVDSSLEPSYFSYPYGKYISKYEAILLQSGVSLAFLNKGGKATIDSPRFYVPRVPVQAKMTLDDFINAIQN
ncbi:hypothetical protein EKG35_00600 [Lysinibacillus telephonicus]|uniref:NodB homology domain-containing protein n=1 Tax=Lysinibacillus telephonicus TaxID=1714840 RepID=A0A3S0HQC2_9BACI|nr:hypothetical protein EKG35_00600 [Lysinibacillus telephonicus]